MGRVDKTDVEVGVGISTYNGPHRVEDLIISIEQHTQYEGEWGLVVIDDGSREENLIKLREICNVHNVSLSEHRENQGISATWNHLTRYFNNEYMILLNDDLIMVDNWLKSLVFFLKNNKCGTAGLPLYFGRPEDQSVTVLKHGQWKGHPEGVDSEVKPGRVMAAPGCCFGFKRTLFDDIGGFDEQFKSFYEEIDFGTECAKRGYPSYAMSYPRIYHLWSATFQQNPELKPEERMGNSRTYYIEKWGGDHDVTHPRYMNSIPPQVIKWWTPYTVMEAVDVE